MFHIYEWILEFRNIPPKRVKEVIDHCGRAFPLREAKGATPLRVHQGHDDGSGSTLSDLTTEANLFLRSPF